MQPIPLLLLLVLLIAQGTAAPAAAGGQAPLDDRRVSGRVVDTAGRPLAGAVVRLWTLSGDKGQLEATTASAADGSFVFDSLFRAGYFVDAEKPGYTALLRVDFPEFPHNAASADTRTADHVHVRLTMYGAGSISGRVMRPDGSAAAGAKVVAEAGSQLGAVRPAVRTGADGRYRIDDLPIGSYVVRVDHSVRDELEAQGKRAADDYREYEPTYFPGTPHRAAAAPIEVRAGERKTDVDVTLALEQHFKVTGTIEHPSGRLPGAVWLEWGSVDGQPPGHHVLGRGDRRFVVGGLLGRGGVLARVVTREGVLNASATFDVTSGPVRGVRLVLDEPARVRGRFVVERGGTLPAGFRSELELRPAWRRMVCLSDVVHAADPEPYHTFVDEHGRFEVTEAIGERTFEVSLPAGWVMKEVRRRGHVVPDGRLTLRAGERVNDIEIVIARDRAVAVHSAPSKR